jgi:hypothetical protein
MITRYRKQLRGQIIKSIKIEIESFEDDLRDHLIKAIRLITQSFKIVNKTNTDADYQVYTMMQFYSNILTEHCPMTLAKFVELYKKVHSLEMFPPPAPEGIDIMDTLADIILVHIENLFNVLNAVFITTWKNYKQQQESNAVALELKRLSAGYFTERDTAKAVSAVDLEPMADKPELQALIRKETQSENQSLCIELNSLKEQIGNLKKPKNNGTKNSNTRGPRGGASSKTNTNNSNKTSSNQQNQNNKNNNNKSDTTNINNINNKRRTSQTTGRKKSSNGGQQPQKTNINKNKNQNPKQRADGNNNDTGSGSKKRKANHGKSNLQSRNSKSSKRKKQSPMQSKSGQS